MDNMGFKKLVILSLILVVLFSGCIEIEGGEEKFVPKDEALKLETVIEREERMRILPEQTIRMLVFLTNQVENEVKNVNLTISNPFGIKVQRVNCGPDCVCGWETTEEKCDGVSCTFNGCHYDAIQSQDQIEIDFSLKIPSEEEISYLGRDLKPEITLKYNYSGESILYIPILRYGEKLKEAPTEFTQTKTKGPIHVYIESDEWVREESIFPLYVEVKDVVTTRTPESRLTIPNESFKIEIPAKYINLSEGRCDFNINSSSNDTILLFPKDDIILPQKKPLACTLKAREVKTPLVKVPLKAEFSYTYEVRRIEEIKVEKSLLKII
jgi:hypothetical protein